MPDQFAKKLQKRRSPYLMFYSTTQFPGLGNVFGTLAEENTSDKDIRKVAGDLEISLRFIERAVSKFNILTRSGTDNALPTAQIFSRSLGMLMCSVSILSVITVRLPLFLL